MTTPSADQPWAILKAKLKQRFAQLTDDDLGFVEGKGEELWLRLEQKLGLSRFEAERVVRELESETTEAGEQVRGFTDEAKRRGEAMGEQIHTGLEQARYRAGQLYGASRQRVQTWEHDFEDYVRENPGTAIGSAVGLGLVIGWALRR